MEDSKPIMNEVKYDVDVPQTKIMEEKNVL
jgi:hypothetical protein